MLQFKEAEEILKGILKLKFGRIKVQKKSISTATFHFNSQRIDVNADLCLSLTDIHLSYGAFSERRCSQEDRCSCMNIIHI